MTRGRWIAAGVPLLIAAMLTYGLAVTPVLGNLIALSSPSGSGDRRR